MNKNYTLKELADIGAKAGHSWERDWSISTNEAFTKAILDAIGYELPKDEEREAFHAWCGSGRLEKSDYDDLFEAWKAGREELRRAQSLDKQPTEPAWIPWEGGECPLGDGVKRWEVMFVGGYKVLTELPPSKYYWIKDSDMADIVAYRVWEG